MPKSRIPGNLTPDDGVYACESLNNQARILKKEL